MAYYNRKQQLYKSLDSINESSIQNYELIIVDDGSAPEHDLNLVELQNHCNGNVILIKVDPEKKTWHNPCVAYNIAFSKASGDKIVIQNPETYHMGDILKHVEKNLSPTTYLTYQTIAPTSIITNDIYTKNSIASVKDYMRIILRDTHGVGPNSPYNGFTIWYNHIRYRPVYYHFVSAMTKENMLDLGGFDERYKDDHSYDDNEFIARINRKNLTKYIISDPMAIHLFHPMFYNTSPMGGAQNKSLYWDTTLHEKHIRLQELNFNNYIKYLK
jgi:glycosyltransferase involved in cell wall biosynthesis